MSNKEQTAVDWLFKQLWDEPKDKFTWYAILKQAKTMHEEEMKQTYFVWGTEMKILNNPTTKHTEVIMSGKKQSSVEWLEEQMPTAFKNLTINKDLFEQAKEKHKEEIEIAFAKSYLIGVEGVSYDDANKASDKYYNETFGKDE